MHNIMYIQADKLNDGLVKKLYLQSGHDHSNRGFSSRASINDSDAPTHIA